MPLSYKLLPALLAMCGGWLLGYLVYAVYMVHGSGWGRVNDFTAIFFWTGWLALLAALTVVPLALWLLNQSPLAAQPLAFLGTMLLASQLVLAGLLLPTMGWRLLTGGGFFLGYAAGISLAFAGFYLALSRVPALWQPGHLVAKLLAGAAIPLLLAFLFYGLPAVSPALAYRYFGDAIQDRAARRVLARYRVGDRTTGLLHDLPGLLGAGAAEPGSAGYVGGQGYELHYADGRITDLTISQ